MWRGGVHGHCSSAMSEEGAATDVPVKPWLHNTRGILVRLAKDDPAGLTACIDSQEPLCDGEIKPLPAKLAALVLLESRDTLLAKELACVRKFPAAHLCLCEVGDDNAPSKLLALVGELTRPRADAARLAELGRLVCGLNVGLGVETGPTEAARGLVKKVGLLILLRGVWGMEASLGTRFSRSLRRRSSLFATADS